MSSHFCPALVVSEVVVDFFRSQRDSKIVPRGPTQSRCARGAFCGCLSPTFWPLFFSHRRCRRAFVSAQRLAWRVDVVTSSKATSGQPATEPTAILELSTGARTSATPSGRLVFEMNRAQLAGILDEVSRIEAVIDRHAGTTDEDDV